MNMVLVCYSSRHIHVHRKRLARLAAPRAA